MSTHFERTRARLRKLLGAEPTATAPGTSSSIPDLPAEAWNAEYLRLMLSPAPGIAERLSALRERGVLALVLPDIPGRRDSNDRIGSAIRTLDHLFDETTLAGKRFGPLLRELRAPDLLVLSVLLRDGLPGRPPDDVLRASQSSFDHLHLAGDERRVVEFLTHDDLRMSQIAFRPDADDPQSVEMFATYLNGAALFNTFNTEEHLKMLCLLTVVTLNAEGMLTPLKAELLWRFYVDTYNHVMKAYGDEVIEARTIVKSALNSTRPEDISEPELIQALEGMPKRYLTLFAPVHIYEHVRLCRNIAADDVHFFLHRIGDVWELTVATLDKPFLFSNICGVLSYFGLDILDGQALTSTRGVVLDLFKVGDPKGVLSQSALEPLLRDVLLGRRDVESLLQSRQTAAVQTSVPRVAPVIAFDNEASHRYTVLEIVAKDAPGLLYRISRALSTFHCEIEMVVISTEEDKAVDVFHVKKDGAKLTDSDELPLTEALEQAVEGLLG
jgi:[protein-PII] uridylyltransferase